MKAGVGMEPRQIVRVARALADPTRLSLFLAILRQGELSCGELAEQFPIAQSTVSHHLTVLTEAGLVRMRKQGQHHYFRACPEVLRQFTHALQALAQAIPHPCPAETETNQTHKEG